MIEGLEPEGREDMHAFPLPDGEGGMESQRAEPGEGKDIKGHSCLFLTENGRLRPNVWEGGNLPPFENNKHPEETRQSGPARPQGRWQKKTAKESPKGSRT